MSLHPEALTWTALLGQWMQFAQAARTLPANIEGERWRKSVTPIINLQAVTFALGDLVRLPREEWPLACDKAEILINENATALALIWEDESPDSIREILRDARLVLAAARRIRNDGTTDER